VPLLPRLASLWRNLMDRSRVEGDLDEEIRAYVDLLAEEKLRAGMTPAQARRTASLESGGIEQVKEEVRDARAGAVLDGLARDLRYAARGLRRSPGFALVSVVSIGLAIGASTAVCTWYERLVARPLAAVPASASLVDVATGAPGGGRWQVSYPDFRDWQEQARSVAGLAAETPVALALRAGGRSLRLWGAAASWNLFEVLGVHPALGRGFRPDDETEAARTAVISHALWQGVFRGDPGVVGRRVSFNGREVTIVGVMPPRFAGATAMRTDAWVPATCYDLVTCSPGVLTERAVRLFNVTARLRDGVSAEDAQRHLAGIQERLAISHPADRGTTVLVGPYVRDRSGPWSTLLAVTLLVVLLACANVANLAVARSAARRREIGIRRALGAGRFRLARQFLVESTVLAAAGGALGILMGFWAKNLLPAPASDLPIGTAFYMDAPIILYGLSLTAIAALLVGLVPALHASRPDVAAALREGAAGRSRERRRLESLLVTAQVALSVVPLVCAALFVRSLQRASAIAPGLRNPGSALLVDNRLYLAGYTCVTGPAFLDRLLSAVGGLAGVKAASVATFVPLGIASPWIHPDLAVEDGASRPVPIGAVPFSHVGPSYFEAIGTPIALGRGIAARDRPGAPLVIVVNETFAARYWPGANPLGKRVLVAGDWHTVVGVARDARYVRLDEPTPPYLYLAIAQHYAADLTLIVRTDGDPRGQMEALRAAYAALDPDLPFTGGRTLAEHIAAATYPQRVGAWALAAFGGIALLLCGVGMLGVLSYQVAQRTREIGVRVAIGASPRDVARAVIGRVLRPAGIGLVLGVALAAGAARLLRRQLLGVSPGDPLAFLSVIALLAAVAALAAWLPAWRAIRVDPIIALQPD
jgi:predicted permease